ncbi:Hypothetical predicted protein [Mytilus galloprovincialis]|uniref:Ig-like domain-containing protein n=1 Tax=Mytilus galloprovincialis TaxID=29158 RepID=A0A8B6GP43_MYTGA|nr:Hypothetical predicted protein [Mytilus galloprovincialis]
MFAVQWKVTTKPLVIGKEAVLACSGYNCPSYKTRKWLGGKNYSLLCFDYESRNISKYEMRSNGRDFVLIIKSLTFSDLNCEYTCACGFHQYTRILQLDEKDVIYLPVVHDHSHTHSQEDFKFQINVSMEVFPLPTCTIVSKDSFWSINISVVKRPEGELKLFEVLVQTTIGTDGASCAENLTLDCKVGSILYQYVIKKPYSCKDDREQRHPKYVIMTGMILTLVLVLLIVTTGIVLKKRLGKNNATEQRDMCSAIDTVVNEPPTCLEMENMLTYQETNNYKEIC